ncbi:hypothetical protein DsansV1_C06g0063211 [Dioscorea sansibarensis]
MFNKMGLAVGCYLNGEWSSDKRCRFSSLQSCTTRDILVRFGFENLMDVHVIGLLSPHMTYG